MRSLPRTLQGSPRMLASQRITRDGLYADCATNSVDSCIAEEAKNNTSTALMLNVHEPSKGEVEGNTGS